VTAHEESASVYWGNSLAITTLISVVLAVAFCWAGPAITGSHSRLLFVALTFGNCLFGQIVGLAGSVYLTFEHMQRSALLTLLANAVRLATLILMQVTMHHATAVEWSLGLLVASVAAAAISVGLVWSSIGAPRLDLTLMRRRAAEGVGFAFAGTTQALYNDVDKTMLSHSGFNRENGSYTLAYRIVDFATAPIVAMDSVVLPRYFHLSHKNEAMVTRLAFRAIGTAALMGCLLAAGIRLVAPVIPHLVGRDFSLVLTALRWLCWLPILRGIHMLAGSALTGTGHQGLRTIAQFSVAAVNVLLNFWWIGRYGWIGAAWSSVTCDGLLAVINASVLLWLWKVRMLSPVAQLQENEYIAP
jgi:O-antigen/teichoic acid export membrane protein